MKIQPRAEVTPEFIETMQMAYRIWLTNLQRSLDNMSAYSRENTLKYAGTNATRVIPIVSGSGLDVEVTRLRQSKFTKFELYSHSGISYLLGTTKHISIHDYISKRTIGELGPYRIFLPVSIFAKPDLYAIHMIPMRNMKSVKRHCHHYTNSDTEHPLDRRTGNCWGSYSGIIQALIATPDIPALFMQLHNHLCTRGNSPPVHLEYLDFDHTTPEA